ncbi:MAG: outer membrane protein transport protein [Gammaproteobacteria bacterium]|nr:outer membrane protein transport protein [Gammaproteobacteria bacterium]
MKSKNSVHLAIASALVSGLFASQASAAGFALIENSASGMGNAYAGGSAIAEDASTVWFNPAGMTRLKGSQISVAGHIISPSADFTDNGSSLSALGGGAPISGAADDGGVTAFVPNFYYTTELGGDAWFGVGITVPFGLSTDYDSDWIGRYGATLSEVSTVNINPSFAFKYNDDLSIGLGLSLQYIEAKLENNIDSASVCVGLVQAGGASESVAVATCLPGGLGLVPGNLAQDSSQSLEGDDWNIGWNIGLLYDIDSSSRVGFAYRSSVDSNLSGDVDFTVDPTLQALIDGAGPASSFFSDTGIDAGIELPSQISVSYFRDVTPDFAIMADVTWTKWSNFDELVIKFDNLVQSTSTTPENWDDSFRFAIGANYKTSQKMVLRFGVAHDQTPIPSAEDRTARIPGDDRTWVSLGLGYVIDDSTSIDVGYSHLFVGDTEINNTDAFGHTLTGKYDADVDILSVQANFMF